ncbi:MAG TPA: TIGR00730 family Rossman fold protein [Candidatus Saccharimonadales bacterium]|nr:TIGR00730 family Rossman fold protein [Candidatus Saccharimonadales bacterium]
MIKHLKKLIPKRRPKLPLQTIAELGAVRVHSLTDAEIRKRMKRIDDDFQHAFRLLKKHPDTVTFFGSSRIKPSSKHYKQAQNLAYRVVKELHLTVVSGGGPGIMEASNRGAHEAQGDSVGMEIELPKEQVKNGYVTHSADFYYFFSRKVALTFTARAYVYFPGGFGTLDELFEILTLKQTGKIPAIPIVLVGAEFWRPLHKFIETVVYGEIAAIDKSDMDLYTITDDADLALDIIAGTVRQ